MRSAEAVHMGLVWKTDSQKPKILFHSRFPEYTPNDMADPALIDLAIASGALTTAGNQYTEEIQKALSISFDEAERIKLGGHGGSGQDVVPQEVEQAMQSVTETVIGEISRSLDFFAATSSDTRIERVFLSGGAARVSGLKNAFAQRSGLPVEVMNPLSRMLPTNKFEQGYLDDVSPSLGVGVGLALRKLERR